MKTKRILVKGAERIYTFDRNGTVYKGGGVLIEGSTIARIGASDDVLREPERVDRVIDGSGRIVLPGLVNMHDHFFQSVTRAVPALRGSLPEWLKYAYPLWAGLDAATVYYAALLSGAELLLSGCTTAVDFFYLYPRKQHHLFDVEVQAVQELGIRFHGIRGSTPILGANVEDELKSMNVEPGDLLESDEDILGACERAIDTYHDPSRGSMVRVGVGPVHPVWERPKFMRRLKALARQAGVQMHTHLHPLPHERSVCQERYGMQPLAVLAKIGWLDEHTWIAHASEHIAEDIDVLAATGASVAHCPSCLTRLGMRVPPIPEMLRRGVRVAIGTDGSMGNGSLLEELRGALMLHRISGIHHGLTPNDWLSPEDVFRMATVDAASILGRDEIGTLEVGKAADMILIDLRQINYAGRHDPLAAIICAGGSNTVDMSIVNGEIVVEGGRLKSGREHEIVEGANTAAATLAKAATERTGIQYG